MGTYVSSGVAWIEETEPLPGIRADTHRHHRHV